MRKSKLFGLAIAGILATSTAADATIIFSTGVSGGSGDVQNILFNDPSLDDNIVNSTPDGIWNGGLDGDSTTLTGWTNQTHDLVDFTSDSAIEAQSTGGQADILAQAGAEADFDYLEIEMNDPTQGFVKVQFIVDVQGNGGDKISGDLEITAEFFDSSLGIDSLQSQTFTVNSSGGQWFTVIADGGDVMTKLIIDSDQVINSVYWDETQQWRIGPCDRVDQGACQPSTPPCEGDCSSLPEPSSLAVFGMGLLGLSAAAHARHRRRERARK